jgi:hypothetical protein
MSKADAELANERRLEGEEDDDQEHDRPGQIDPTRAYDRHLESTKRGREEDDTRADRAQERRHIEDEHREQMRLTAAMNTGIIMQQMTINAALGLAVLNTQTANQGGQALDLQGVAALLDKIVAISPPPTGGASAK